MLSCMHGIDCCIIPCGYIGRIYRGGCTCLVFVAHIYPRAPGQPAVGAYTKLQHSTKTVQPPVRVLLELLHPHKCYFARTPWCLYRKQSALNVACGGMIFYQLTT